MLSHGRALLCQIVKRTVDGLTLFELHASSAFAEEHAEALLTSRAYAEALHGADAQRQTLTTLGFILSSAEALLGLPPPTAFAVPPALHLWPDAFCEPWEGIFEESPPPARLLPTARLGLAGDFCCIPRFPPSERGHLDAALRSGVVLADAMAAQLIR